MSTRKAPRIVVLVVMISMLLMSVFGGLVSAQSPVVHMILFYSADCPDCKDVVNVFVPTLQLKYGAQLDLRTLDIANAQAYELLQLIEKDHGIGADKATIPEAFIANIALIGRAEIESKLDEAIKTTLAAGGAEFPLPKEEAAPTLVPIPTVTPNPAGSVPGAVHIMLFFSPTCPHCHTVRSEVMPPLYAKYGDKLVVREFDVTDPYYFSLEMAIEETAGLAEDKRGYVPMAIVGKYLLTNAQAMEQGFDEIIQEYLAEGGAPWPVDPKLFTAPADAQASVTPDVTLTGGASGTPAAGGPKVRMAYFAKAGCSECDRAQYEINYLKDKYPFLDVTVFDISEYAALNEWITTKYSVPDQYHLTAPAIFVGDDYLVGKDVSTANIEKLIQKYSANGAASTWDNWQTEAPAAGNSIIERFKSFGVLTIILAALVDGLNPCAFATIVFFVSYLAFAGRKGREILLVGAAFALGVFLTYLAVGLGLYNLLTRLPFLSSLKPWLYGITAVLCVVLAIFSILDFFAARRGSPEEMRLRIPINLRRRINTLIRESASAQALAGVALVTGIAVSLIELACTGQVYLPTIIYVQAVPELRARATLYLLLYNVLFITPLIVVFVLAYFGTSTEKMGSFVSKNTTVVKLASAILFIVLAVWLVLMIL